MGNGVQRRGGGLRAQVHVCVCVCVCTCQDSNSSPARTTSFTNLGRTPNPDSVEEDMEIQASTLFSQGHGRASTEQT